MARIAGINIPPHKHAEIGLTSIFGIGRPTAQQICERVGIPYSKKIKDLSDGDLEKIREEIGRLTIEHLKPGKWRILRPDEIAGLQQSAGSKRLKTRREKPAPDPAVEDDDDSMRRASCSRMAASVAWISVERPAWSRRTSCRM